MVDKALAEQTQVFLNQVEQLESQGVGWADSVLQFKATWDALDAGDKTAIKAHLDGFTDFSEGALRTQVSNLVAAANWIKTNFTP